MRKSYALMQNSGADLGRGTPVNELGQALWQSVCAQKCKRHQRAHRRFRNCCHVCLVRKFRLVKTQRHGIICVRETLPSGEITKSKMIDSMKQHTSSDKASSNKIGFKRVQDKIPEARRLHGRGADGAPFLFGLSPYFLPGLVLLPCRAL